MSPGLNIRFKIFSFSLLSLGYLCPTTGVYADDAERVRSHVEIIKDHVDGYGSENINLILDSLDHLVTAVERSPRAFSSSVPNALFPPKGRDDWVVESVKRFLSVGDYSSLNDVDFRNWNPVQISRFINYINRLAVMNHFTDFFNQVKDDDRLLIDTNSTRENPFYQHMPREALVTLNRAYQALASASNFSLINILQSQTGTPLNQTTAAQREHGSISSLGDLEANMQASLKGFEEKALARTNATETQNQILIEHRAALLRATYAKWKDSSSPNTARALIRALSSDIADASLQERLNRRLAQEALQVMWAAIRERDAKTHAALYLETHPMNTILAAVVSNKPQVNTEEAMRLIDLADSFLRIPRSIEEVEAVSEGYDIFVRRLLSTAEPDEGFRQAMHSAMGFQSAGQQSGVGDLWEPDLLIRLVSESPAPRISKPLMQQIHRELNTLALRGFSPYFTGLHGNALDFVLSEIDRDVRDQPTQISWAGGLNLTHAAINTYRVALEFPRAGQEWAMSDQQKADRKKALAQFPNLRKLLAKDPRCIQVPLQSRSQTACAQELFTALENLREQGLLWIALNLKDESVLDIAPLVYGLNFAGSEANEKHKGKLIVDTILKSGQDPEEDSLREAQNEAPPGTSVLSTRRELRVDQLIAARQEFLEDMRTIARIRLQALGVDQPVVSHLLEELKQADVYKYDTIRIYEFIDILQKIKTDPLSSVPQITLRLKQENFDGRVVHPLWNALRSYEIFVHYLDRLIQTPNRISAENLAHILEAASVFSNTLMLNERHIRERNAQLRIQLRKLLDHTLAQADGQKKAEFLAALAGEMHKWSLKDRQNKMVAETLETFTVDQLESIAKIQDEKQFADTITKLLPLALRSSPVFVENPQRIQNPFLTAIATEYQTGAFPSFAAGATKAFMLQYGTKTREWSQTEIAFVRSLMPIRFGELRILVRDAGQRGVGIDHVVLSQVRFQPDFGTTLARGLRNFPGVCVQALSVLGNYAKPYEGVPPPRF